MKSTIFKTVTAIIGILGAIGGIVMGNIIPTLSYNTITETYDNTFNVGVMIGSWICVAVLCLIFYGITSVLEYLEELGAGKTSTADEPTEVKMQPVTEPMEKGDWLCPECGKVNKKYVGSCGCGYSKNSEDLWECPRCHTFMPYNQGNECSNCHWRL